MAKCLHPQCPGHLGRFASCLTEAVWEASLDFPDATTGDTGFEGHYALMIFPADELWLLDEGLADQRMVRVPAGVYIVESADSGAVFLLEYDCLDKAREDFAGWEAAYGAWMGAD